jgi:predicted dehydrogenase
MKSNPIAPLIAGKGMAGQAILKSLAIVSQTDPELNLLPARFLPRAGRLNSFVLEQAKNVLFIANPSGLHAQFICEGAQAGFAGIVADKPVCVRPEEVGLLRDVNLPVAVFHGYRVMWGTRTIRNMIEAGELGEVFCFESRYWQSSSAHSALRGTSGKKEWKNDPLLNGPWDVLTDLGSHVADICLHLMSDQPVEGRCHISHKNSPASHRDTHVQLYLKFPNDRSAVASISKTVHGATNNFEYTIIGTKGAATWRFLRPDEVEVGSGNLVSILRRETPNASSGSVPFHSLGWLEGYVEITRHALRRISGLSSDPVPTLKESLAAMEALFNAAEKRY